MTEILSSAGTVSSAETVRRYAAKVWDWDAFPASRGYPELARAQMRYVGAGGSPKVGDVSTLVAKAFTCSLLYQEPRRYAAVHTHEIEEIFLVNQGRMTVSWDFDGEMVDVVLGPGDALVNPAGRAHGFRNDGPTPVFAQFMVGHPKPMLPSYKSHPSKGDSDPRFGAPLPAETDPRAVEMESFVARASNAETIWHESTTGDRFAVQPYVLPASQGGIVEPGHFSLQMVHLPANAQAEMRACDYDVVFMVWSGNLAVTQFSGPVAGSRESAARLSAFDLVRILPGNEAHITNRGAGLASAAMVIGTPSPDPDQWT